MTDGTALPVGSKNRFWDEWWRWLCNSVSCTVKMTEMAHFVICSHTAETETWGREGGRGKAGCWESVCTGAGVVCALGGAAPCPSPVCTVGPRWQHLRCHGSGPGRGAVWALAVLPPGCPCVSHEQDCVSSVGDVPGCRISSCFLQVGSRVLLGGENVSLAAPARPLSAVAFSLSRGWPF